MNAVIFDTKELQGTELVLSDERSLHLQKILKVNLGSRVRLGEIGVGLAWGSVTTVDNDQVVIEVDSERIQTVAQPLHLILALPRPQMLKRILETVATFGVEKIYLTASQRVERSFFHSPLLKKPSLRKHLLLGMSQGMITREPEVQIVHRLDEVFEKILTSESTHAWTNLIAHPSASLTLLDLPKNLSLKKIRVAIGPEGGWQERELKMFETAGFDAFCLGTPVLRVESAVTAALSQIALMQKDLQRANLEANATLLPFTATQELRPSFGNV